MGESCAGSASDRRTRWRARRLAVVALLLGLTACNPVDTWRDLTGVSRNDPDPDTTPNTKNLAAGEASDYPNLATVPPPPERALTAAEREKLTQSLIADRTNARHTDEQLRAGFSPVAAAPPPPPGEPGAQPEQVAAAPPPSPTPFPPAPATPPSAASAGNGAVSEKPAKLLPSLSAEPASASTPTGVGAAGEKSASPLAGAPRTARGGVKMPTEPGQGLRKQGEPPEPGPMESSLDVPQARAMPEPEQIQPAPPPPQLPPTPKIATTSPPMPGGLAAGGALAPMPLPEAKSSAGYEPPPAAPELPPVPPTRTAAAGPGKGGAKPPERVGTPVAEIKFGTDSTTLTDKDRQTLETVLPVYQQNPGKVRIVGYAGAGGGAVEQLDSYRTALGRAQAVATALTKAGIPSDKIQVEAAPQGENAGESRAEVLLEH
ncbi:MAG: OmpA family protein [Alphaproteobacteria bacterium]|nr:OmpA family protein [Alphaproteobacteria bacterium]